MSLIYKTKPKDLIAYIGPHNRGCCYEVGEEVLQKFRDNIIFKNLNYISGRKINLEACIEKQLLVSGLQIENIMDIGLCTSCSKIYKLHSYRRAKVDYGRMYSFVFIKN